MIFQSSPWLVDRHLGNNIYKIIMFSVKGIRKWLIQNNSDSNRCDNSVVKMKLRRCLMVVLLSMWLSQCCGWETPDCWHFPLSFWHTVCRSTGFTNHQYWPRGREREKRERVRERGRDRWISWQGDNTSLKTVFSPVRWEFWHLWTHFRSLNTSRRDFIDLYQTASITINLNDWWATKSWWCNDRFFLPYCDEWKSECKLEFLTLIDAWMKDQ